MQVSASEPAGAYISKLQFVHQALPFGVLVQLGHQS